MKGLSRRIMADIKEVNQEIKADLKLKQSASKELETIEHAFDFLDEKQPKKRVKKRKTGSNELDTK
jgi:hypothetical protein